MADYGFDLKPLVWIGAFIVLLLWGTWELVDWLFIDDAIRSTTPITPKIELSVKKKCH